MMKSSDLIGLVSCHTRNTAIVKALSKTKVFYLGFFAQIAYKEFSTLNSMIKLTIPYLWVHFSCCNCQKGSHKRLLTLLPSPPSFPSYTQLKINRYNEEIRLTMANVCHTILHN